LKSHSFLVLSFMLTDEVIDVCTTNKFKEGCMSSLACTWTKMGPSPSSFWTIDYFALNIFVFGSSFFIVGQLGGFFISIHITSLAFVNWRQT
jgi:hypothetical protein